jgi:hypothetical protein
MGKVFTLQENYKQVITPDLNPEPWTLNPEP